MPYGKSAPGLLHYVHKKVTCGPEVATFRTKTRNFTRVIHLTWLAKIELRGPAPPDCQIVINYCCSRVLLLHVKMQKGTEETIGFFVTFLYLVVFQLKGGYTYGWR